MHTSSDKKDPRHGHITDETQAFDCTKFQFMVLKKGKIICVKLAMFKILKIFCSKYLECRNVQILHQKKQPSANNNLHRCQVVERDPSCDHLETCHRVMAETNVMSMLLMPMSTVI